MKSISAEGIAHVKLIDASPIGINVRSTVATYANIHDELRKSMQKQRMRKTGNTKRGIFPTILESCAARSATEPGRSVWMYSFYRMWTSHARNVAVPGTRKRHGRSAMKINRETGIPCRN